jgi:hypothetical protein
MACMMVPPSEWTSFYVMVETNIKPGEQRKMIVALKAYRFPWFI